MQEAKLLQGPTGFNESKAEEEVQQDQAARQKDAGLDRSLRVRPPDPNAGDAR